MIPFSEQTVAVQRPTFESIADDLECYQETLLMLDACIATGAPEDQATATLERVECLADIDRLSEALVKKTDDLACVMRRLQSDAKLLKSEEVRLRDRRKAAEESLERLKGYTQRVMNENGWKHLKTTKNTVALRGNGGVHPLSITDASLIPDELCTWQLDGITPAQWKSLLDAAGVEYVAGVKLSRAPSNYLIRASLAAGESVPGAHLEERGCTVIVR